MNTLWFIMIFLGILMAGLTGRLEIVQQVLFEDAQEAVHFSIGLIGIMSVWLGLMNIAEKSGLLNSFSRLISPITRRLFPAVPANHPAMGTLVMNLVSNMFGAGNATTALGLKAMEELQQLNHRKDTATRAMCMFLVLNMSSVQLVPMTVIKLRADAGSQFPAEIIVTSLLASSVSTLVGILACKAFERGGR